MLLHERALSPNAWPSSRGLIARCAPGRRWRPRPRMSSCSTAAARTSLHLFEHVHGDSRDRGPAMIDLAQTYEKAGLYLGRR
jgi:nitrate reductase delta subunit